jgi:hypothetical protein
MLSGVARKIGGRPKCLVTMCFWQFAHWTGNRLTILNWFNSDTPGIARRSWPSVKRYAKKCTTLRNFLLKRKTYAL